ncbi:MAG: glutaredoxin 3 [Polyangiaceae bacterium]
MLAEVVMYRTRFCPYCMRASALLERKGAAVREIDVSNDPPTRERLLRETGSHTVPQVFINGVSVGGFDDISALERSGSLEALLREAPSRSAATTP